MGRMSPVTRNEIRKATPKVADSTSGDAELDTTIKQEASRRGRVKAVTTPAAKQPKSIMDTVKGFMKPRTKKAQVATKSEFPTLTNAERDSLSKKYLDR